ncbi:MAG: hypothetical protein ACNY01_09030 [Desulfobacteria bacterium]
MNRNPAGVTADRKKTICLRIEGFFTRDTTENDLHLASSRISDSALVPVILFVLHRTQGLFYHVRKTHSF